MSNYSAEQKAAIINKLLISQLTLREFSEQQGIAKSTLYTWKQKISNRSNPKMTKSNLTAEQRFAIVLESATLSEAELSQYCREKALYPDQVKQWKQSFIKGHSAPVNHSEKADKKRIKELEKELQRKEKALAETAALLVLRKKFNAHFDLEEE